MKNVKLLWKDPILATALILGWLLTGTSLILCPVLFLNNDIASGIAHLSVGLILCWGLWIMTSAGIDSIKESEQLKLEEQQLQR